MTPVLPRDGQGDSPFLQPERPAAPGPRSVRAAVAATTLLICVAVLLGWALHLPSVVQLRADWAPMQPNAAVGLALVSLGLLASLRGFSRLGAGLGVAAIALAALTLAQDLFRLDLGLDSALMRVWLSIETPHPGRMAPNTAAGLMLLGLSIALMPSHRWIRSCCSIGAFALGAGALLGYATGLDATYDWGSLTPMAPATATCLVLSSVALLWDRDRAPRVEAAEQWHAPLVAGLGSVALALLFFQALLVRQENQIDATVQATSQRIGTEIRAAIRSQRDALGGLAREWNDTFFKLRSAWESDARIVLARSQGMAAVAWFEPDGGLNWSYPPDEGTPRVEVPRSAADVRPWLHPVTLSDGSAGFALVAPVLDDGSVDAWLCGFFRADEFFGGLSTLLPAGYAFRVDANGVPLYTGSPEDPDTARWMRRLPLGAGTGAEVAVQPTSEWIAGQRSLLPHVLLGAGLLVSALLVWALRAARQSSARALALEGEVRAHERAEEEIRTLNLELEGRVSLRTAELQRSNEALQRFASFLSHELRQPLAAQAFWAEILDAESAEALDARGRECVTEIRRSTRRMGDLIAAQLSLAALPSTPRGDRPVELGAVLEEVVADLKRDLDRAGATLHRESLAPVRGDVRLLYQLLRNLVENSIKYRRTGHPLEIRITSFDQPDGVEIHYTDNGRGIAPEDAQRIFGAFERAQGVESEGLGLGLTLCRRIMERLGGSIDARVRIGEGAAFSLRFPDAERSLDRSPDPEEEA